MLAIHFTSIFLIVGVINGVNSIEQFEQAGVGPCDDPQNSNLPFCDPELSIKDRVNDLISRIPEVDYATLLNHNSSGSAEITLGPYNWWNEGLHGVAISQGVHFRQPTKHATSFPQVLSLASSFNYSLFLQIGNAIGNEARAFSNVGNAGLTYWSPNINIYRDPRWGRGHETPGEDPHLTGKYATAFVRGMQSRIENPNSFLKVSACCKHFSAYSQEAGRESLNAIVSKRDMADTYSPAFHECVINGGASCVMCSYNAVNGVPSCADKHFLTGTIRAKWRFKGYIVSDCAAVQNILNAHHYTNSTSDTLRVVLDAGMDLECDDYSMYKYLPAAMADGSVTKRMVLRALSNLFGVMMRLGYFEKVAVRPYQDITPENSVDTPEHKQLALAAAHQSIVLLKNNQSILPLDKNEFLGSQKKLALIGPHLNSSRWLLANYEGVPSFIHTPLQSIQKFYVGSNTLFAFGCGVVSLNDSDIKAAVDLAQRDDVSQVILFMGLSMEVEYENHDRVNLNFPGLQKRLIDQVLSGAKRPVILVLITGGIIDLTEYKINPMVGAILNAGYAGQAGGLAIADVLFGKYNPSGRLTQTWYPAEFLNQVPIGDMNMRPSNTGNPGRTYRFYTGKPVYAFGFGLSYTTFEYKFSSKSYSQKVTFSLGASNKGSKCGARVSIAVTNSGTLPGDHSVLWFLNPPKAGMMGRPLKTLIHFDKMAELLPGETRLIKLCLVREHFQLADENGNFHIIGGRWKLSVGSLVRLLNVKVGENALPYLNEFKSEHAFAYWISFNRFWNFLM